MTEVWKEIDWSNGKLEVSDLGRVRSNMRDGRILKTQHDSKGYLRIRVSINHKKMSMRVHREVARAFLDNPDQLPQVNHIDGDKENNRVENLEWISNKDNSRHAVEAGLWGNVFAASSRVNESRKTPVIATNLKTGEKLRFDRVSDAERFCGTKHVSAVLNGKRTKAAGFSFCREVVI